MLQRYSAMPINFVRFKPTTLEVRIMVRCVRSLPVHISGAILTLHGRTPIALPQSMAAGTFLHTIAARAPTPAITGEMAAATTNSIQSPRTTLTLSTS